MPIENKKTKILYVITKSNWGGAQRYVYDLATSLPKKEFEVMVVLGGEGLARSAMAEGLTRRATPEGELTTKLIAQGIPVLPVPTLMRDVGISKDIASFFALRKIFKNERPDVIHLNSSKVGGLGALAGRIAGVKKIIFTAHGWAFNEERPWIQIMLIKFLSWLTMLLSHRVIVVSRYDEELGNRMPFVNQKIIHINNGVKRIKYASKTSARENLLGETPLVRKKIWLGTIAELHPNKGISYALQGLKNMIQKTDFKDFLYVVVGEGEDRDKLKILVEKLDLNTHVVFVGKKENAATLLRAFDIFILPSTKEGLPYVILEAGIAGIPTVASAVGGIPEVIEDMQSGILVKPKNPEEIALALEFLFANPQKRAEFGETFKECVVSTLSIEKMVRETLMLYKSNDKASNTR